MRRLKGYQIATYICRWIEPGDKHQEFKRECDHNLCINSTDERVVERKRHPVNIHINNCNRGSEFNCSADSALSL